jgi:hypothetical protein
MLRSSLTRRHSAEGRMMSSELENTYAAKSSFHKVSREKDIRLSKDMWRL